MAAKPSTASANSKPLRNKVVFALEGNDFGSVKFVHHHENILCGIYSSEHIVKELVLPICPNH